MKTLIQKRTLKGNYLAIVVIVFIWSTIISLNTYAELRFNSEKLKQVFGMLPDEYKRDIENNFSSNSGSHLLDFNFNGDKSKLVFRFNEYQELDHLGLCLVNDNPDIIKIREVFDYLERAFLVSALLKESYPLIREVNTKKIEVLFNGSSFKIKNRLSILPDFLIDKDTPFKIKYNSDYFLIEWTLESSNVLVVKIPNNYSLITEKTKDELELDLLRKLRSPQEGNLLSKRPTKNQLKPYESNIYLYQGDIYSNIPEISSTKYFEIKDSIYPVFGIKNYKESICNLFLDVIPSQVILNVTQKLYGGNDEKFRININSFFRNFSTDYKVYFGWQNDDKENLKASIIICNTIFNYTHLLEISTNDKIVFNENGEVDAMFFAYTPKGNFK